VTDQTDLIDLPAVEVPEPKLSLRDRIALADDIDSEMVDVEAWDVTVQVRGMTGQARAVFMATFATDDGGMDYEAMYPSLLISTVFDPETGQPAFTAADAGMLNSKSGSTLEKLAQVAMRLSGLGRQVENELGKSSPSTENDASTSL